TMEAVLALGGSEDLANFMGNAADVGVPVLGASLPQLGRLATSLTGGAKAVAPTTGRGFSLVGQGPQTWTAADGTVLTSQAEFNAYQRALLQQARTPPPPEVLALPPPEAVFRDPRFPAQRTFWDLRPEPVQAPASLPSLPEFRPGGPTSGFLRTPTGDIPL